MHQTRCSASAPAQHQSSQQATPGVSYGQPDSGRPDCPAAAAETHRILPFSPPDHRKRRAMLADDVFQEARRHAEFSRCLTKGETVAWKIRLTKYAIEVDSSRGFPLGDADAARVAERIAHWTARFSHSSEAQAKRNRDRAVELQEQHRPRDEGWLREHDAGATWREIGERHGCSPETVRRACYRLRARLKDQAPAYTGRYQGGNAPPEISHRSSRLGPVWRTFTILDQFTVAIERGESARNAILTIADPLQRQLKMIANDRRMCDEETRTILSVLQQIELSDEAARGQPSPRQAELFDDDQGDFGF